MSLGRADIPISPDSGPEEDKLGLDAYAQALAKFVRTCETPMTVGVQGEWGSGKTSLMNMVRRILKSDNESKNPVYQSSFETWQYGALGEDDALGLQLINTLAEQIMSDNANNGAIVRRGAWIRDQASRFGQSLTRPTFARALASGLGGMIPGVDGPEFATATGKQLESIGGRSPADSPAGLNLLRSTFQTMVSEVANVGKNQNKKGGVPGRFVIFIDDLDRVRPGRAVALLEVLKNFLDVEHCVFVIACDYEVVRLGVREKFGIESEEKVLAFFHKIIQVPFQMPVNHYQVGGLLREYLVQKTQNGKHAQAAAIRRAERLAPMVGIATGTNPRAFKRFLNVLDLNSCVNSAAPAGGPDIGGPWASDQAAMSLIGLVALQTRWPQIADYVTGLSAEELASAFSLLRVGFEEGIADASELVELLQKTYTTARVPDWKRHPDVRDLCEFIGAFWNVLDTHPDDDTLSEEELQPLLEWAEQLSLTRVNTGAQPRETGWMRFAAAARKNGGMAAERYLYTTDRLLESRRGNSQWKGVLEIIRAEASFYVFLRIGARMPTVLSFSPKLKIKFTTNIPPECGLEGLSEIASECVKASGALGAPWQSDKNAGARHWTMDFGDARFADQEAFKDWCALLCKTLDRIAKAVRQRVPAEKDQPGDP